MKHLTTTIKESLLSDFDILSRETENEMMWGRLTSISTFVDEFENLQNYFRKNYKQIHLATEDIPNREDRWRFKKRPGDKTVYVIFQKLYSKPGQGDATYNRLWFGKMGSRNSLSCIYTYNFDASTFKCKNIEIMTPSKTLRCALSAITFEKKLNEVEIYKLPEEYMWLYNRLINM